MHSGDAPPFALEIVEQPLTPAPAAAVHVGSGDLFGPACRAVGNLAGKHERLRAVLMEDQAWPLRDVLAKLVEAGEILMHQKNYDGHGWEEISTAIERGKAALLAWPNNASQQRAEIGDK